MRFYSAKIQLKYSILNLPFGRFESFAIRTPGGQSVHKVQAEMVWFQCEDCGDNLKKPKLPNHFRMCSASKVLCFFFLLIFLYYGSNFLVKFRDLYFELSFSFPVVILH